MKRVVVSALLAGAALLLAAGIAGADPRTPPRVNDTVTPTAAPDVWLGRLVGRYSIEGAVEVVFPGYGCAPEPESPGADLPPPDTTVSYCTGISGKGDCVRIGTGPGVQCVLSAAWQDLYESVREPDERPGTPDPGIYTLPGGTANLAPAMVLFGLDPGKTSINHLLVDQKGLPEGGLGLIAGNTATFKTTCVNAPDLFDRMKPPSPLSVQPRLPGEPHSANGRSAPRKCERTLRIDAKPDAEIVYMSVAFEINNDLWTRITLSMRRVPQSEESAAAAKPSASR